LPPVLGVVLAQLLMVRRQIEKECPDGVIWAVAFGRAVERLTYSGDRKLTSPNPRLSVLVVTNIESPYEAHIKLGEDVFGPVLLEFGTMIDLHILTPDELRRGIESKSELWRRIQSASITIYGSADAAKQYAQSSVS
jgi:hypothetical protein